MKLKCYGALPLVWIYYFGTLFWINSFLSLIFRVFFVIILFHLMKVFLLGGFLKYVLICTQAALFFGVDELLVKCRLWLAEVTSFKGLQSPQLCLYGLTRIWKYGLEHGKIFYLVLEDYDKRCLHENILLNSFNVYIMELSLIDGSGICCSK